MCTPPPHHTHTHLEEHKKFIIRRKLIESSTKQVMEDLEGAESAAVNQEGLPDAREY